MKQLVLSAGLMLAALAATAGGFGRNETGQKALGLGGAFTAIGRDASVAYFNPGSLVRLDTHSVSLGFSVMSPHILFSNANTGVQTRSEGVLLPLGYLYASYQINHKWAAGLSVNSPYAYNTEWPTDWEGRSVARKSSFYSVYVQPTISYRITDKFSIGGGPVIARGNMAFERQIGEYNVDFSAKASGYGLGYNLGIMGNLDEFVSFGITYRSAIDLDLTSGEATFGNRGVYSGIFPASTDFRSKTTLPSTLSVGVTDRISDKVSMVFEFNLIGWSEYDSLYFEFPDKEVPNSQRARLLEDAMVFRAGLQYRHDSLTTFRGGLYYDESPFKDPFLSADLPDANRIGLALGVSRKLWNKVELDVAYSFEAQRERSIESSTTSFSNPTLPGTYKTFVHSAGVGLNFYF